MYSISLELQVVFSSDLIIHEAKTPVIVPIFALGTTPFYAYNQKMEQ